MLCSSEQRVRQVLNLIWLTERCMELPRITHADRGQWAAELERARRELELIAVHAALPDDLAEAVARALGGDVCATGPTNSAPGGSAFRGVTRQGRRLPPAHRVGE